MPKLEFTAREATTHKAIIVSLDLEGFSKFCNQPEPAVAVTVPNLLKRVFDTLNGFLSKTRDEGKFSLRTFKFGDDERLPVPAFNKFTGDGALMGWIREPEERFPQDFCNLVVDTMRRFQNELSEQLPIWEKEWQIQKVPKKVRVGVATGIVFGLKVPNSIPSWYDPFDYTGYCINLAVRLQSYCPRLGFLVHGNYAQPENQAAAAEAIRHIGSPAVPFLVERLSEARWKQFTRELQKWQETQGSAVSAAGRPRNPRGEALAALDALGAEASGALPALEKLLHETPPDPSALYVIARMGPAGIPVLAKYRNSDVRILRLEANICMEMIASHSEILYPKIPVGPDAASFNRRISEFNLQVIHAASLEYRTEHPEMNFPSNADVTLPPSIPMPVQ